SLEKKRKRLHVRAVLKSWSILRPDQRQKIRRLPAASKQPQEPAALPPVARLSEDALKNAIDALRVKNVKWRGIEWKTCLLDGIKASVAEKKPIVVWNFIDRPIDDERC
ncbi:MAG: hypothetical protein AAF517_24775, partial [Planctomycetota bacterium]